MIVSQEQSLTAQIIRDAVLEHNYASKLLEGAKTEQTILWRDEDTDVDCKARADAINAEVGVLIELKTTISAEESSFARSVANFAYHLAASHYLAGLEANGFGSMSCVFIAVENSPPHGVALYVLDERSLYAGEIRRRTALETYATCRREDRWPSYPEKIRTIQIPAWGL
jgi:exodeoxyribonuclease VIII